MKIKICGIKRKQDILYVNLYQPDYIGFIFADSSRRVSFDQARELKALLDPKICAVGVFVDAAIDDIVTLAQEKIIDMIQLHGHEDQQYIDTLRQRTSQPIIKAIRVIDETSFNISYDADYYLLDGKVAGSGQCYFQLSILLFSRSVVYGCCWLYDTIVSQAIARGPLSFPLLPFHQSKGFAPSLSESKNSKTAFFKRR